MKLNCCPSNTRQKTKLESKQGSRGGLGNTIGKFLLSSNTARRSRADYITNGNIALEDFTHFSEQPEQVQKVELV